MKKVGDVDVIRCDLNENLLEVADEVCGRTKGSNGKARLGGGMLRWRR